METIELKDGVQIEFETSCGDYNTTAWAWLTVAELNQIAAAVQRHREPVRQ